MHPFLAQYDVLAQIFGCFADDLESEFPTAGSSRTLLSASLTCRGFREPALNALWRTLHSLKPLFDLIPCFQPINNTFTILGQLTYGELQRYRVYAHRVRNLYARTYEASHIHPIAYTRLRRALGMPLLPSLQVLHCFCDGGPLLSTLLVPTLVNVRLSDGVLRAGEHTGSNPRLQIAMLQAQAIDTFLNDLVDAAPHLRSLDLEGVILQGVSLRATHRLTHLTNLAIDHCYKSDPNELALVT